MLIRFLAAALLIATGASAADTSPAANIKPYLLTPKTTYDTQPTLCQASDKSTWAGWVAYAYPKGDAVMAAHLEKGVWSAPEQINSVRGQIIRPTLCAVGTTVWAFWTETGDNLATVMGSTRTDGKWSTPIAISSTKAAAQNQEVAVDKGGKLFLTWQEFRNGQYDIALRTFANGKWSETSYVTNDKTDDWDPAIVCDSKGGTWVAWSSYREGDYDLYVKRVDTADGKEQRLSARGEYDLHPALAADNEGRVWVAWDVITIPRHGESGNMTITGANLKKRAEQKENDPENPNQAPLVAQIRLACLDNGKVLTIPKSSKALTPPEDYKLAHTAMPKLSVDANGTLWVGYRALTKQLEPAAANQKADGAKAGGKNGKKKKNGQAKKKPRGPYWWDVFVQSYNGKAWSTPTQLPESDGTLEEVSLLSTGKGVQVAYEMEHRKRLSSPFFGSFEKAEPHVDDETDHHGDFGKTFGYNGDIYFAQLAGSSGEPAAKSLVVRKAPADAKSYPRVPRETAHRDIELNGKKYTLLWGDLHKHSNISRCSTGNEPAPEDHYKYAQDVCQYDFLAMTDHAEHTTEFNWWRIQKLADLYNIPGAFSVLYGYEWTASWPIGHHNIIWPERPSALLRANVEGTKTTKDLWSTLAKFGKPALTIPHTSADPRMGTRWDNHDDRFERICEVFQACRGSYEYDGCPRQHVNATATNCFVQDGLAKDYRMGMIGSSDHGWGTAYAVVYATENSRQAAWQGLYDRRCYASTTYGLVVDFRMGQHIMGEEITATKPEEISVYARGTAPIRQIDIFSDRKLVHSLGSVKEPIGKKEVNISWTPESLAPGTSYYYARIIQEDDEIAWTSPIWITNNNSAVKKADAK
ncbi:MAG: hypothetical protein JWM68_2165 [Verrucomicrobiales bacterium]|nr:hypothetical protein [Verrucomicrobiales bacterium]